MTIAVTSVSFEWGDRVMMAACFRVPPIPPAYSDALNSFKALKITKKVRPVELAAAQLAQPKPENYYKSP
jgi:hypothetical protein